MVGQIGEAGIQLLMLNVSSLIFFNLFSAFSNICRGIFKRFFFRLLAKKRNQNTHWICCCCPSLFRLDFFPLFQFPAETVFPHSFWPHFALDRFFNSLLNPVQMSVIFFFLTLHNSYFQWLVESTDPICQKHRKLILKFSSPIFLKFHQLSITQ